MDNPFVSILFGIALFVCAWCFLFAFLNGYSIFIGILIGALANSFFNNSLIPLKILKDLLEEPFKRCLLFAIEWLNALD
jgi:hypothetical protein